MTVAARLRRARRVGDLAIIEPAATHDYQPAWTLVGGGEYRKERTRRPEASVIPRGVTWIRDAVTELVPEENVVLTRDGVRVGYDHLVLAPGIQIYWDRVRGLREALGKGGVCTNYSYEYTDKTWEFVRAFPGGTAVFTQPEGAIKCGGAPQKVAYLADDYFRRSGVREKSRLIFASAMPNLFPVAHYAPALEQVMARKGIETRFRLNLVEIRPETSEAVFRSLETGECVVQRYDFIHVTPPQGPPEFIRCSPVADRDGWVEVDRHTLQHPRYPNVFSLGDASSLPTSRTGAAVRGQAPVLVANLLAHLQGKPLPRRYDGYTACPVVTGYGRLILMEFDYDKQPRETFPFDQRKERWSMYLLKKHLLPAYYWRAMLRGRL